MAFPVAFLWPVPTVGATQTLIWKVAQPSPSNENASDLVWTDADASGLIAPDTLAQVWLSTTEYAAAATLSRRWAAVSDFGNLRFFCALGGGQATEWDVGGQGDMGIALAPLNDTTVFAAWSGVDEGLHWAIAKGSQWIPGGHVPDAQSFVERPRLAIRKAGGVWLTWGTIDNDLLVRSYSNQGWGDLIRIPSQFGSSASYRSYSPDLSRDAKEWPMVAWSTADTRNANETICVASTDLGSAFRGSRIAGSEGGLIPSVARDKFGDVWVGWWRYFDGIFWTHTYTHAVPSPPVVSRNGTTPVVSWTISEPAPGSHWSILRSSNGSAFDSVGAVVAGESGALKWTDKLADPSATLAYQIRRDCLDIRYRLIGGLSTTSVAELPGYALALEGPNPVSRSFRLAVTGARPGPIHIEIYDAAGRLQPTSGTGQVESPYSRLLLSITSASRMPAGVYFARAVDSAGARTEPVKVVVVP